MKNFKTQTIYSKIKFSSLNEVTLLKAIAELKQS